MKAVDIAIIDYGMGNLHSVERALRYAAPQANVYLASNPADVQRADRVVFPGQGAMRDCMRNLDESGLRESVLLATKNKPLLGVCVGEQMLFSKSEEGDAGCLNVFEGTVKLFKGEQYANSDINVDPNVYQTERLKVPHMGWSQVKQAISHPVWEGIPDNSYFYFVHSYYVSPDDSSITAGTTDYGINFTCAVAKDNIFAAQFHPEKSSDHGLRLYSNFVQWNP